MKHCLILLSAFVLIGCPATGNYDPDDPRLNEATFEIVGPSTFTMRYDEEVELTVRYLFPSGDAISGAPISFEVEGDPAGSQLSARSTTTGGDGQATMRLRSGTIGTGFVVKARSPRNQELSFMISVSDDDRGSISIDMSYRGETTFERFTPYLFRDVDCATLDPESLPMAVQVGSPVNRVGDRAGLTGVTPDTGYIVAVTALSEGQVRGFGCATDVGVENRTETLVSMEILDVEPRVNFIGTYDLNNRFDFGGALPPSVDLALNILDELTDDQDINGNEATMDFGQDPGAFITDFAMRQTCAWECRAGEDYDSCSEDNHRYGDISALYLENFTSWSGAEARFTFGCGAWEIANRTAQEFINRQIGTSVPEIVLRLIDSLGDVSRAVTQSHILSELTLDVVREGKVPLIHELRTMQVTLRDLGGMEHIVEIDLADVGLRSLRTSAMGTAVGSTLQIPAHSFQLHFGMLVRYVYLNALLPLFGFTSTADMLASWIDCGSVADGLVDATMGSSFRLSRMQYLDACTRGIELAGGAVDDGLAGLIDEDALLTLSGSARAADVSTSNVAQRLEMGMWTGGFDESGMSGTIAGTFTGELRP